MTDISLQETATTVKRVRGRPFAKGRSGNPGGRPRGSINRSTRAAQLLLDGEATALSRKAVELALAGDPTALRLCLGRTVAPRRDRSVELALPPIDGAADILGAIKVVATAVGRGGITPGEGFALSQMIESFLRAIDASDFDNRLRQLEDAQSARRPDPYGYTPAITSARAALPIQRKTANRQRNCRCCCAPSRHSNPGFPRRSEADRSTFAAKNSSNS